MSNEDDARTVLKVFGINGKFHYNTVNVNKYFYHNNIMIILSPQNAPKTRK